MPRTFQIVDADTHVNPPPTFWASYLPKHLRELAPKLEEGEDADYVVFEGRRRKINLIGAQAGREGKDFKMEGRLSDARSGGWMPAERLADMDRDGMDVAVMFGGGPLGTGNDELFMASFDAYNRWLADFCSYAPGRLSGVAYLPMRDVAESVRLMREVAQLGFTAVNIPAFPQSTEKLSPGVGGAAQVLALTGDPMGPRRYDQPEFDPFWAAAVELDMAITIHLGARSVRYADPDKFLPDLPMSKVAMAEPIAILIFGGVFQRFPGLKFASIESGVGWFSWFANYMDETWKKQRFWTKSGLTELPSFYMDRNVYGSFIHDRVGVLNRNLPGGRNIMWSSDYPHSETTYPHSQEMIATLFEGVPETDKLQIVGGVAKKLFRTGDGMATPVKADQPAAE
jgi:predicted TIM-barrel fold metal-dependent hydrolase